jgi:beta-ketodecanoyl-[acyl-carrier-protein] synthase
MHDAVVSATGLFKPPHRISNEELVESFNAYVERFNAEHAEAIAAGQVAALVPSSTEFIEKASGIKNRYVMEKDGVLDPARMYPRIAARPDEQPSVMAEMAAAAALQACERAGIQPATSTPSTAPRPICSAPTRRWPARSRPCWAPRATAST